MSPPRSPCPPLPGVPGVSALMSADHQEGVEHNPEIAPLQTEFEALQAEFEQPKRDFEAKLDSSFSKLPPKNARASRLDRSARGTRGGCRTAGRHPPRHAKSNLFAARRRPVRVPRDRRRSPSRPARRARSTRRAWPQSRAQYFEPATRAEVGAMLTADPDTLTAHDIASGATWADRYRDSDRGGSRQRYEQTRQWHFVNIELDGPNLDRACFGHPRLPAAVPASSGPAKACLVDKIEQFTAELSNSATAPGERLLALEFLLHLVGDVHQPLHAVDDHDVGGNRKQGGRDRIRRRQPPSLWEKRPTNRVEIRRNPGVVPRLAVPKAVPQDSGVGQLFSTEDSNGAAMTDEPTAEPCPPLRGVPGVSALMSADHQEGVEHNPEIAPLQTEFEALQTEFEALQAEFEQPKRDFEAKLDEWSERAEPVWKAIADDLEERAPDVRQPPRVPRADRSLQAAPRQTDRAPVDAVDEAGRHPHAPEAREAQRGERQWIMAAGFRLG